MAKVGRNDPCPCGSGKKYKKCCLNKEQAPLLPQSRHEHCIEVVNGLQERIMGFAQKPALSAKLQNAEKKYLTELAPDHAHEPLHKEEIMPFIDWLVHDYTVPGEGRSVVELFLASNPKLPAEQRQVLEQIQEVRTSAYHVLSPTPGLGVEVKDAFDGRELFLSDVALSQQVGAGDFVITRALPVLDEWQPSSQGVKGESQYKKAFLDLVQEHYAQYRREHPHSDMHAFLKEKGFILPALLREVYAENFSLPKVMTSGGEEMEFLEAHYDIQDKKQILARLDQAQEFDHLDQDEFAGKGASAVRFAWLELGESAQLMRNQGKAASKAIKSLQMNMFDGEEAVRSLGDVTIKNKRLVLQSMGRERFQLGKQRLEDLLNGLLKHRLDSVRSLESMMAQDHPRSQHPLSPTTDAPTGLPPLSPGESTKEALANREFEDIDQVNDFLQQAMEGHNQRGQAEMAGLSPVQVRRLLSCDWQDPYGPLRLNQNLELGDLRGTDLPAIAGLLLTMCHELGGVKATQAGYFNTSFVLAMAANILVDSAEEREAFIENMQGRIKELDIYPLHLARILCEVSGLLELRGNRFIVTPPGQRILEEQDVGQLYTRLFSAHFRDLDLDSLDPSGNEYPAIAHTLAFSLYVLSTLNDDQWHAPSELYPMLLLPIAKQEVAGEEDPTLWGKSALEKVMNAVDFRIISPLYEFGLLEDRDAPDSEAEGLDRFQCRPSPLFNKFISFHLS